MSAFMNEDQLPPYGMGNPLYSTPELAPMYSALSSGDTLRQYQKQNNIDEVTEGLSWSERLEAGATGLAHGLASYGPEQIFTSRYALSENSSAMTVLSSTPPKA